MGNVLYATLLGGFSLSWPERDAPNAVTDHGSASQQVWTFLAYLCLHHQRQVDEQEMIRALWGDSRTVDAAGALKMILQRARNALETLGFPDGRNVLTYGRGCFGWAPGLEFELDTDEMDRLCAAFAADPEGNLDAAIALLSRCGGEALPNAGRLDWVSELRTKYRSRWFQLLRGAAEQLGKQQRYGEAIPLCQKAAELEPFDEGTHSLLMNLLHSSGASQSALWHYRSVSRMYIDQLGIAPSGRLSALYQQIAQSGKTDGADLLAVRRQLEKGGPAVRPMYCEYPVFRMIYQWIARSMPRSGAIAQIAVLTVLDRNGMPPSVTACGAAMETLKTDGLSSLREGDVCTRMSPNQYLLLLPSATEEDAQMTLIRCLTAFEKTRIGQTVAVHTGVQPVLPIEL